MRTDPLGAIAGGGEMPNLVNLNDWRIGRAAGFSAAFLAIDQARIALREVVFLSKCDCDLTDGFGAHPDQRQ